jgi:hypothetical protein
MYMHRLCKEVIEMSKSSPIADSKTEEMMKGRKEIYFSMSISNHFNSPDPYIIFSKCRIF